MASNGSTDLPMSIYRSMGAKVDLWPYRNERGEFRRWLHVFRFSRSHDHRTARLVTLNVLPWVFDNLEIDGPVLECMHRLGAFKDYPDQWKEFQIPRSIESPIYGVLCPSVSAGSMMHMLSQILPQGVDFVHACDRLKPHIIFKTAASKNHRVDEPPMKPMDVPTFYYDAQPPKFLFEGEWFNTTQSRRSQ